MNIEKTKSNQEILAYVIGVDVKSIKLHKSATVRVDEALKAMEIAQNIIIKRMDDYITNL